MAVAGDAGARERGEAAAPARRRRWPRRLGIAFAIALLLAVVVRALLPTAIERGAAWAAPRYLGLPVRIENADLWLVRGAVALEGVAVGSRPESGLAPAADGTPPRPEDVLLRWDRVFARIAWGDLFSRTVHVRELEVDAPGVRAERLADGRIDPLANARPTAAETEPAGDAPGAPAEGEAAAPAPAGETAAEGEPPAEPWAVALDRLEVRRPDVQLVDAATGETLVQLALDDLRLEDVAMRGEDLSLGGLAIHGPVLRVRRDYVMAPAPAPAAEEPAAPAAAPPGYRVSHIGIERAQFTLLTERGPVEVAIELDAHDIALVDGHRFPLRLHLELDAARIDLLGMVGALPPAFDGRVEWDGLSFPPLLRAAVPELESWLRSARSSGAFDVSAQIAATADAAPGVHLRGRTVLADFAVADPSGEEVAAAWSELEVLVRALHLPLAADGAPPGAIRVDLERVRLVAPDVRYTVPSPALDALLGNAAAPSGAAAAPAAGVEEADAAPAASPAETEAPAPAEAGAPTALALALGALEITDGVARYEDRTGEPMRNEIQGLRVAATDVRAATGAAIEAAIASLDVGCERVAFEDHGVEPAFRSEVRDLSLAATGVRWPERTAESLRARGVAADGGSFQLTGAVREGSGDVRLDLEQLALPPFDPYARSAAGYSVGGAASLESRVRIRGTRYDTRNALTLHQLDLSSESPGDFEQRFGVPLDLALALLRDPAGNISLTIPVSYDERAGASVGIGSIIAGALRQALVGALTSPFKMLGSLASAVGGGDGRMSIAPIAFAPGSADVPEDARESLAGIAKLLGERPTLAVRLRGRTGPADRPAVAQQILIERATGEEGLPPLEDAGFLARRRIRGALEALGRGEEPELDDEDRALLERYVAATEVPAERLVALANARAERLREAAGAAHGVAPEHLPVGDPAPEGDPGVVLELTAR